MNSTCVRSGVPAFAQGIPSNNSTLVRHACLKKETPMRRAVLSAAVVSLLASAMMFGASLPSSKATAQVNTVTVCVNTNSAQSANPCTNTDGSGAWRDVMTTQIKTSNVADLFAGASLVTGIYTLTTVKGNSTGATSTAVAEGTVKVRVLLDPTSANCQTNCSSFTTLPDMNHGVTFDQRIQSLSANLGFIFTSQCAASPTTCTLTPEQITLVLDTTSAHSFNFILPNVGTGTHTITVQAQINTDNTSIFSNTNGGISASNALFGLGSLTIDSVRLVNSFTCDTVNNVFTCTD